MRSPDDEIASKGAIQAEHLKLAKGGKPAAKTVAFDFALNHDMKKRAGSLQRGQYRALQPDASWRCRQRTLLLRS